MRNKINIGVDIKPSDGVGILQEKGGGHGRKPNQSSYLSAEGGVRLIKRRMQVQSAKERKYKREVTT